MDMEVPHTAYVKVTCALPNASGLQWIKSMSSYYWVPAIAVDSAGYLFAPACSLLLLELNGPHYQNERAWKLRALRYAFLP